MMRHVRLVMSVLAAVFAVAVPTALAQTPVADQYETTQTGDVAPTAVAGDGDVAPNGDEGRARPVAVPTASRAEIGSLPFTGGQVSLLALIGLGLLALGAVGLAATRGGRASWFDEHGSPQSHPGASPPGLRG